MILFINTNMNEKTDYKTAGEFYFKMFLIEGVEKQMPNQFVVMNIKRSDLIN